MIVKIIVTVKNTDNIIGLKEAIAMRLEGLADVVRMDVEETDEIAVKFAIDNTPTADVAPRSEVENYKQIAEYQQKLAMDRYFEIKRLQEDVERWRRNLEAVLEERAE